MQALIEKFIRVSTLLEILDTEREFDDVCAYTRYVSTLLEILENSLIMSRISVGIKGFQPFLRF